MPAFLASFALATLLLSHFAVVGAAGVPQSNPSPPVAARPSKTLRVGFGDNSWMPKHLLRSADLVNTTADLELGTNAPQMKITKFFDTSKMTPAALAARKERGFNWLCYDNENGKDWPTPKSELADPTKYTILAAKLAHEAGFKFMAEPNFELIVGRGNRGIHGKLILTDRVVPAVRMAEVAPHLDAISLQLQRAQADVEQYRRLTRQYVQELRAANPKVIIFVQVTSREKTGKTSTPAELMPAIRSVGDVVDGIWIHTDKNQEAFAEELMTLMAQEGWR